MEVVATYRGETLSTSSAQVRAATVVGTLELESWRVNERRPATQAGRSSSRRVSSRPQVSKSLEQQLALRACVRGGAPDTNNLLNPLQVQAHMSGSVCWRRHACGRRRRMSAWRRRGSHGQKPPAEKTACYQLAVVHQLSLLQQELHQLGRDGGRYLNSSLYPAFFLFLNF